MQKHLGEPKRRRQVKNHVTEKSAEVVALFPKEHAFTVTIFPNQYAQSKKEHRLTLVELGELIRNKNGSKKSMLPFVKLARFGSKRTGKNCIRNNANVLEISGVELDYDAKQMTLDEAVGIVKKTKLKALLYTSASYSEAKPKWRIVLPTSKPLLPGERLKLVARVNGLFGGIFDGASFTLSQSYYFGSVGRNPAHRVEVTAGDYVDLRDDLDAGAIYKNGATGERNTDSKREEQNWAEAYGDEPSEKIPLDELRFMLLEVIPNTVETGRKHWIDVGHALKFERPDDDGKDIWLGFCKKFDGEIDEQYRNNPQLYEKELVKVWNGIKPDGSKTGGSLVYLCDEADPDWCAKFEAQKLGGEANSEAKAAKPDEVAEPVDLWAKREAPPLPKGLLPPLIEQFAFNRAEVMGCDPSGLAMGALVVCAAAIPDKIQLQSKTYDKTWNESTRIWVALGGPVSAMKSPIMRAVTYPITQIDKKLSATYRQAKADYDALKGDEKKDAEKPKHTRVRIEDTTPEALQPILQDSPEGVLLVRDELSGWFGSMDKYSGHRGAAADRGFWLSAFNGGYYSVDRVSRGSTAIDNLSVSVLGGIQEDALRRVVEDNVDDGLVQRLFVIMLRPAVLGKDEPGMEDDEQYNRLVEKLYATRTQSDPPLQFTPEAAAIRRQLEQKHLDLQNAYGRINKKLAAHIMKYNGLFVRLCLLWHVIETIDDTWPSNVTADTAQRVADFLHEFLLQHAIAFYVGVLGLSDQHDRLQNIASYILAHKLERITARDVQRGDRSMRGLEKAEVENIFHHLYAMGWVTPEYGRQSVKWNVNKEVHRIFAARAQEEAERRERERAEIIASEAVARRREEKAAGRIKRRRAPE